MADMNDKSGNSDTGTRPLIGLSMGDPLGIGPEILVKSLLTTDIHRLCRPLVIGDVHIMRTAINRFGRNKLRLNQVTVLTNGRYEPGIMNILPASDLCGIQLQGTRARMTKEIGQGMITYITTGVELAVHQAIDALVTCPITKTGLAMAGSRFTGHTELIAHQTGTPNFAMMLAGTRLRVVLVTIHIPLSTVPKNLSTDRITQTIELTRDALVSRFNIANPQLAVAGLNPHAGEDSLFGPEDRCIIQPAVTSAQKKGIRIQGPLPPDTIFNQAIQNGWDAVICMYHDQGLIPFKLIHFSDGVNVTLGLPIIRTSVDHGTAYDIAWKGKADPSSLIQAVKMAVQHAIHRTDRFS